jgi:hypothetical protein
MPSNEVWDQLTTCSRSCQESRRRMWLSPPAACRLAWMSRCGSSVGAGLLLPVPANRATHSAGICRLFRGNPTPFFLHSVGTSDPGKGTSEGDSVGTLVEGWPRNTADQAR